MNKIIAISAVALAFSAFGAASTAAATETYTPPTLDCETWQVPGWLNEHGDPTGCVDNAPCPEARKGLPCPADLPIADPTTTPVAVAPVPYVPAEPVADVTGPASPIPADAPKIAPTQLAETGVSDWWLLPLGAAMIAAGLGVARWARETD